MSLRNLPGTERRQKLWARTTCRFAISVNDQSPSSSTIIVSRSEGLSGNGDSTATSLINLPDDSLSDANSDKPVSKPLYVCTADSLCDVFSTKHADEDRLFRAEFEASTLILHLHVCSYSCFLNLSIMASALAISAKMTSSSASS